MIQPRHETFCDEKVVKTHAEGNKQIRSDEANSAAKLDEFNVFRKSGLYGACDSHNRTIIPPIYEDMRPYFKGYIPFKQNGKWGIMLRNGSVKVKPKYYNIGAFTDGIAEIQNTEDSKPYHINEKLERVD